MCLKFKKCCHSRGCFVGLCLTLVLCLLTPRGIRFISFRTDGTSKVQQQPLTIHSNQGRLGNQMFTFATLYGIGRLNGRDIALMPGNHAVLSRHFDIRHPVVNLTSFSERNPWLMGNWLRPIDHHVPPQTNILKGNLYPTSFTFFEHVREDIRRIFRFPDSIVQHAQDFLSHVRKIRPWTQVLVGIHVRRGDYLRKGRSGWLRAFGGRQVDLEYFRRAVAYFRNRYSNVTFLAVSDDRDWCRTHLSGFGILTAPDSPGAVHDLALLTQCNHTIMTYGTFGFWAGYLGGGEVVYFTDFLPPNTTMTKRYFVYDKMYPKEWVGISTTKPGYWENRKRFRQIWKKIHSTHSTLPNKLAIRSVG